MIAKAPLQTISSGSSSLGIKENLSLFVSLPTTKTCFCGQRFFMMPLKAKEAPNAS
jgi:hypothetical protein